MTLDRIGARLGPFQTLNLPFPALPKPWIHHGCMVSRLVLGISNAPSPSNVQTFEVVDCISSCPVEDPDPEEEESIETSQPEQLGGQRRQRSASMVRC